MFRATIVDSIQSSHQKIVDEAKRCDREIGNGKAVGMPRVAHLAKGCSSETWAVGFTADSWDVHFLRKWARKKYSVCFLRQEEIRSIRQEIYDKITRCVQPLRVVRCPTPAVLRVTGRRISKHLPLCHHITYLTIPWPQVASVGPKRIPISVRFIRNHNYGFRRLLPILAARRQPSGSLLQERDLPLQSQ